MQVKTFCGLYFQNNMEKMNEAVDDGEVRVITKPDGSKWAYMVEAKTVPFDTMSHISLYIYIYRERENLCTTTVLHCQL